jgi:hypothetical protein
MSTPGRAGNAPWVWTGAIAAPLCWFIQQLLASWLVPADCRGRQWLVPSLWIGFSVLLLAAMLVSWRDLRRVSRAGDRAGFSERRARFVGTAGTVMPMIFLLAMAWQGIAGLVYSGCER